MCRMERAIKRMSRKKSRCSSGAEIQSPDFAEPFLPTGGDYLVRRTQLSKISEGDEAAYGSTIRSDTKSLLEGRSWVMDTGRSDLLRSNLMIPSRSYTPVPSGSMSLSSEAPGAAEGQ